MKDEMSLQLTKTGYPWKMQKGLTLVLRDFCCYQPKKDQHQGITGPLGRQKLEVKYYQIRDLGNDLSFL
jgi:hypothetical protein